VPEAVASIAQTMASFPARWALSGGWAIDAWLGRETREHGDIDVSVSAADQQALFAYLRGWQLVPHSPHAPNESNELWDGHQLTSPTHLHARRGTSEPVPKGALLAEHGFVAEFQIDDREGDHWVVSRQPPISVPVGDGVMESAWGVPAVAPEVLLFFKSRDLRRRDKVDFATVLPHLADEKRAWLRDAIARMGHPWVAELS
jgi:hypothetical protein